MDNRTIDYPVGATAKAVNVYNDVLTIQQLLDEIIPANGGPNPALKVDGICGPKTKAAIQNFQLKQFGWKLADGRVDPGGKTLSKMNEMASVPDYKSTAFRFRRAQPDSEAVPASKVQVFLVEYLEFSLRKAIYAYSAHLASVNPLSYPASAFQGSWTVVMTKAPLTIRQLSCPAVQYVSSWPPTKTPWGPPDPFYKVTPNNTMDFYHYSGPANTNVVFETVYMWGEFAFVGELT